MEKKKKNNATKNINSQSVKKKLTKKKEEKTQTKHKTHETTKPSHQTTKHRHEKNRKLAVYEKKLKKRTKPPRNRWAQALRLVDSLPVIQAVRHLRRGEPPRGAGNGEVVSAGNRGASPGKTREKPGKNPGRIRGNQKKMGKPENWGNSSSSTRLRGSIRATCCSKTNSPRETTETNNWETTGKPWKTLRKLWGDQGRTMENLRNLGENQGKRKRKPRPHWFGNLFVMDQSNFGLHLLHTKLTSSLESSSELHQRSTKTFFTLPLTGGLVWRFGCQGAACPIWLQEEVAEACWVSFLGIGTQKKDFGYRLKKDIPISVNSCQNTEHKQYDVC